MYCEYSMYCAFGWVKIKSSWIIKDWNALKYTSHNKRLNTVGCITKNRHSIRESIQYPVLKI
jgi:hypothetical protein